MKKLFYFFLLLFIGLFFTNQSQAQVTNLVVNGTSPGSTFTMESGGAMSWSFDVPNPGDTGFVEIWLDLNNSGTIDSGDKIWQQFGHIDGDTQGNNGPPDTDGQANGTVTLTGFKLGLAPASYVMKVTNNGTGQEVAGTVTRLTNVAFTISGKVTVPNGVDPQNVTVELSRNEQYMPFFWDGLTDAQGNYTIEMTGDTTGNPWDLRLLEGQFDGNLITPSNGYQVTVDGNKANMDFTVAASDAKVVGTLRDENGTPMPNQTITLQDVSNVIKHYVDTDMNGFFQFGLSNTELNGQKWFIQTAFGDTTTTYMDYRKEFPNVIVNGDSIHQDLTAYLANSTITGQVSFQSSALFGGNNQEVAQITIIAMTDSTQSTVHNDTTTGNYTLRVSDKLPSYRLFGIDLPSGYDPITIQNVAPGATNVNFNYTLTDVKERTSGIPESFSISQNYPNPFNPTTNINYDIPNESFVNIVVFNELGQKVMILVNKEQKVGKYVVSFNAKNMSSGIYYYQIKAGNFMQTKKMILLK